MHRAPMVTPMSYEVSTPVFEGPFELLLHLILKEKVELYEISLSSIVDGYLAELSRMEMDLEVATEFLLIAATLVELKTRRLLPDDGDVDLDDELALWDERDLLLARLLDCKTFKDAARALAQRAELASRSLARNAGLEERFLSLAPDLLAGVTPEDLRRAFRKASAPRPAPTVQLNHIAQIRASVTDAVEELVYELPRMGKATFRQLTESLVERLEVVVRFLAVLELYKQGYVELDQAGAFGDIEISWIGASDATEGSSLAGLLVDAYEG